LARPRREGAIGTPGAQYNGKKAVLFWEKRTKKLLRIPVRVVAAARIESQGQKARATP
jgi:hypothetical protein